MVSIMVSPAEWGPNAWALLHALAEKIGNQTNIIMIRDQQNYLKNTLKTFWCLLPCQKCQAHYRDWLKKHPPDAFTSKNGFYLQDDMRSWVYTLHENVNERREVTSGFQETMLAETYSSVNIRDAANELKTVYQRGLQIGVLKPEEWKAAWRNLDMLIRFI